MQMHSSIVRNTLLSPASVNSVLGMQQNEDMCASLQEILVKFQDIRKFASEIHTETHMIKPILKLLGYVYESKPKYFDEQIKGPDIALFPGEDYRVCNSPFWGTKEYFSNTLAILLLKRYGRNLEEGISGFYLEFENRIPLYQAFYLLKETRAPWGILTNGRYWVLIKRPSSYEMKLISMDVEKDLFEDNGEALHLFHSVFSLQGLIKTLPELLEHERTELISVLQKKKASFRNTIQGLKKRVKVFPGIINTFDELFPGISLPLTVSFLQENSIAVERKNSVSSNEINICNLPQISSYLMNRKSYGMACDISNILPGIETNQYTKEHFLSLKILDMTPNFGNTASELIDAIAYFAFKLPYSERHTFNTEWENETSLKRHIIDKILFGVEKSQPALDVLQASMKNRLGVEAPNYKLGNPLVGISLRDIPAYFDEKGQAALFNKNFSIFLDEYRAMFKQYFSLSDRIKEDLQIRHELEVGLRLRSSRIGDVMDIITSTYFSKTADAGKIQELLANLDSNEQIWNSLVSQGWFLEAKTIAKKNSFFHLELQFPFLLIDSFDLILIQPALQYLWEDEAPITEITRAYIKRGMYYLKTNGVMVILLEDSIADTILHDAGPSKRYEAEKRKGCLLLHKKA